MQLGFFPSPDASIPRQFTGPIEAGRVIGMIRPSTLRMTLVFRLTHPGGDFFDYDE
jgi:hypothetical protein